MSMRETGRSAALSYDGNTILPASAVLKMRHDYMAVEPLGVFHSLVLAVVERIRPVRGIVKAIGPGTYPNRYDHPDKHRRTKMWKSRTFQPTQVQVGDIVELGMVDGNGYAFQTFLWGDTVHLICTERDVSGVEREQVEPESNIMAAPEAQDDHHPLAAAA